MQSVDIYKQNKTKLKKENLAHAVQKKTACGDKIALFGNPKMGGFGISRAEKTRRKFNSRC